MVPVMIAVLVLVIIGLINFDFMVSIVVKLVPVIVVAGVFTLMFKRLILGR
jgi:hypothetical protein